MAQKYVNTKEAAEMLHTTVDEVRRMLEARELHGYRDGADWKFKVEDIEKAAREHVAKPAGDDDGSDVLLSEVELGSSAAGASGTVIGMKKGPSPGESDLILTDSDVKSGKPAAKGDSTPKASQFEELDLTLDEDLTLDDGPAPSGKKADESAVDLGGKKLADDELVLGGGSGAGSDITLGGDSGIQLLSPEDSGLSLEQPLEVAGAGEESLELGEDDMLTAAVEASGLRHKGDDEFLLTPLEEGGEGEDSESGSQVIALDTEGDEAATMIGAPAGPSMAAMLEEDLSTLPAGAAPLGMPLGAGAAPADGMPLGAGAPMMQYPTLPEAPYSGWNVTALVTCAVLLILCGMFTYDLMRNMWSWDSASTVNSPIMDWVLNMFEK